MTPLELARLFHQLAEASYKVAVWDEEERQMHEITMRALCALHVLEGQRKMPDNPLFSDERILEIIKCADELYAQIVGK